MSLRLVIFDVDGTLVDSQADIIASMGVAFETQGLEAPQRESVLSIVGLSLPRAVEKLAPEASEVQLAGLVAAYKESYAADRAAKRMRAVLYPGALEMLHRLHAVPDVLLAVATGKSRRGLDFVLEMHGLKHLFVSTQVADDHPSKPHPSMVLTALAETGVEAAQAVMVGDTTYDMEMAAAAQVPFVGVGWGYHPEAQLTKSLAILESFQQLDPLLDAHWRATS